MLFKFCLSVFIKPHLFLLYFGDLVIKVVDNDRRADLDESELLDDGDINTELKGRWSFYLFSSLFFALATAYSEDVLFLALLLGKRVLDLTSFELVIQVLSGSLAQEVRLCFTCDRLGVLDKSCLALQFIKIADDVLASIELLFVRMRQTLDVVLAFFLILFLFVFTIENSFLLLGHPLDVKDFFALHLEVIACLPIVLTLGVLLFKQVTDVLGELIDFF